MANNFVLMQTRSQMEIAKRKIQGVVGDFSVSDEKLLELRSDARLLYEELTELERKAKRRFLSFLGF